MYSGHSPDRLEAGYAERSSGAPPALVIGREVRDCRRLEDPARNETTNGI